MKDYVYDRMHAVAYARKWAYGRNPRYYDFEAIGGDCTNYASQCIYAGCGVMNDTPTFGWYYKNINDRGPAWTSVEYLYQFLSSNREVGPYGRACELSEIMVGDLIQLKFEEGIFGHSPVVVETGNPPTHSNILVAAHSFDTYARPLSSYLTIERRPIHILGYRKW